VERIRRAIEAALPNQTLASFELLQGGASNLNYLLRFHGAHPPAVLRICTRDPQACEKELAILRSAFSLIAVPEIIHACPFGNEHIGPHMIYRFAEGITFQELKRRRNQTDTAQAAYAIGAALATVRTVPSHNAPPRIVSEHFLSSALLEQRIGAPLAERLRAFISGWLPWLNSLNQERALVHGDFNNRNTIVQQQHGRWAVSGILDWELASVGSPLWDAARFICYEHRAQPCREPHFSRGFCDAGGSLPKDWTTTARVINLFTAAESLARPDLPPQFATELRDLVIAVLDDRDPS
jgi:aminoglycoside phosphotransferase (APT) family kinase protein